VTKTNKFSAAFVFTILPFLVTMYAAVFRQLGWITISDTSLKYMLRISLPLALLSAFLASRYMTIQVREDVEKLAKKRAGQVAAHRWIVKEVIKGQDIGGLLLHTDDRERLTVRLFYEPGHPDFDRLLDLSRLDRIEFELTKIAVSDGGLESDYLVIKDAVKFS
jgi:membrane protein implicated in regulation of membrane protease activity